MSRSGGSLHVQPGVISLRGAQGAQDSPSSVSLTGLAGLEAAQGSLTSNALFGSLNLVSSSACIHVEAAAAGCGASLAAENFDDVLGVPYCLTLGYCRRPGTRLDNERACVGTILLVPLVLGLHRLRAWHAMRWQTPTAGTAQP